MPKILAIDTSCDDSSAAVVEGQTVLSNIVASQNQIHKKYGGVFPTLAKQAHRENLPLVINKALQQAQVSWEKIAALAVTIGPGLAPALEVGINQTQQLALTHHKKIIAVNHVLAHALSPLAMVNRQKSTGVVKPFAKSLPSLAIVVSGGHTEFILVKQIGHYQRIGYSLDDAAGECLDKVGRLLNLGYPAGPLLEKLATKGQTGRFNFPKTMTNQANFNLSFSGLKTAARQLIDRLEKHEQLNGQTVCDLALAIQDAVFEQIVYKLERILFSPDLDRKLYPNRNFMKNLNQETLQPTHIKEIWLGGGVAANLDLRKKIRQLLHKYQQISHQHIPLRVPYSKKLCSDNAAMIGLTAGFKLVTKQFATSEKLDRQPNLTI